MKIAVLMLTIAVLAATIPNVSEAAEGVPVEVQTPQALMQWMQKDFTYAMKMPDKPQSVEETINRKKGDCDDFAVLAQSALSEMGIKSHVIIIEFKGLNVKHAVCVWKDTNGTYNIISNRKQYRTGKPNVRQAISKYYPDWQRIVYSNAKRQHVSTETRA